jgi:hypothetical protein
MMALKQLLTEMYDQISEMVESIDLLYAGLITDNLKVIDEALGRLGPMGGRTDFITEELVRVSKADPDVSPYVSVPSHIGRMRGEVERIAAGLKRKVKDTVLFSDKAVTEAEYLFERVRDMLVNARDMVLARNTLVARHLEEAGRAVERTADDYATKHEERLIEGLCAPRASDIFLEMLEAFKAIAWHAKEIGKDLG